MTDEDQDGRNGVPSEYIFKASVIGADVVQTSAAARDPDEQSMWNALGAGTVLQPPYDPAVMLRIWENSGALSPNIDSYVTNIDGLGHRFRSLVDFDSDDAFEMVRELMWVERLRGAEQADKANGEVYPSDDEVTARMKTLRSESRLELVKLKTFFEYANPDGSFTSLRRKTRFDLEVTGNAYWEVLRSRDGEIARFVRVPPRYVRCTPLDADATLVTDRVPLGLGWDVVAQRRFFRRYVQQLSRSAVWFKQFGDPRVVSQLTGKVYQDRAEFEASKSDGDRPATELIHFRLNGDPYGQPRWIGNLLAVLGSRAADEVNYDYFDNKAVPPLALLVSGGRLNDAAVERIETYFRDEIKGRKNFHKILVIEATGEAQMGGEVPVPKIDFKPLKSVQNGDAQFQKYDERNIDKVGSSFRLPRLLRGDVRDFNRACYDERTETLTRRGWKRLGEFEPNDEIAAYDPVRDEFEFVVPAVLHVYDVDEEMLHFRSGVADIMVTEDHRMLARGFRDDRFSVHRAQEIPWTRYALKTTVGGASGERMDSFVLPKHDECQIERGHDHRSAVDGDTFLEFLGFWLSEGSLLRTDHPSAPYIVTLSQEAGAVADAIRACLERTGWDFSESREEVTGMSRWCISNRCLREWLLAHCGGGCAEKRLPSIARNLSTDQSRVLFDALMQGDGHWDRRPNRTSGFYPSVSRALCDDVQVLALRLGYRASLALHYPAHGNRQTCWRVMISGGRDAEFRAEPERVHYQGRVYCFSVPEYGFFVTRRNGKVAVQGNTADASLRFADEQVFQPERNEFDDWINRVLLPRLNARLWKFRSHGPRTRDPETVAGIVKDASDVITPNESREILSDALDRELPQLEAGWAKQPLPLTLAGFPTQDVQDAAQQSADALAASAMTTAADAQPADPLRVMAAEARAITVGRQAMEEARRAAQRAFEAAKDAEAEMTAEQPQSQESENV